MRFTTRSIVYTHVYYGFFFQTTVAGDLLVDDKPFDNLYPHGKHTAATWKVMILSIFVSLAVIILYLQYQFWLAFS